MTYFTPGRIFDEEGFIPSGKYLCSESLLGRGSVLSLGTLRFRSSKSNLRFEWTNGTTTRTNGQTQTSKK